MYLLYYTNIFNCLQGYTEFKIVDIMEWVFLHTNAKKKTKLWKEYVSILAYKSFKNLRDRPRRRKIVGFFPVDIWLELSIS